MPLPIVSKEILESVASQSRQDGLGYLTQCIGEMRKENPILLMGLIDSSSAYASEILKRVHDDKTDDVELLKLINLNIFNACVCTYNTVKQQSIVDELEG